MAQHADKGLDPVCLSADDDGFVGQDLLPARVLRQARTPMDANGRSLAIAMVPKDWPARISYGFVSNVKGALTDIDAILVPAAVSRSYSSIHPDLAKSYDRIMHSL